MLKLDRPGDGTRPAGLLAALLMLLPLSAAGSRIAGIELPDNIRMGPHTILKLNGAGVRKKLFYTIYVGALYLQQPSSDSDEILHSKRARRIALHFVYDEVSAEKLIEGWNDGFVNNLSAAQLQQVRERLHRSYAFFQTMHAGDSIYLDFLPGIGTRLSVNDRVKGIIPGDDFFQAVLKVWIGDRPAQQELKQAMLGG